MIRPKIPKRVSPHQQKQPICQRKSPVDRSVSPLTQFTHLNLEEIDSFSKPNKFSIQPMTPPIVSDCRTPSATLMNKETLTQRHILKGKVQSGKKSTNSSTNSTAYNTQGNSMSLLQHNYLSSHQDNLKGSGISSLVADLKRKKCKENLNVQYIYGIGTQPQSKTKFIQLSMRSNEFVQKKKGKENTNNHSSRQTPTSFANEDDQDLFYHIIKQRTQMNTGTKKSPSPTHTTCHFHQDKRAKYYKKDDRNTTYLLCSQCAILHASQQCPIFRTSDHAKVTILSSMVQVTQEVKDWAISPRGESTEQQTKLSEMQVFLERTQTMTASVNFLVSVLNNFDEVAVPPLMAQAMIKQLLQPIQQLVEQRTLLTPMPGDVMTEIQDQLSEMLDELSSIKRDIQHNMPNIIQNMEMKPFRLILQKYYLKIDAFESNMKELHQALNKNFGLPNIYELLEHVRSKLSERKANVKQVYISFENKESFVKAKQDSLYQTDDSILLRSSETQKFLDYLKKDRDDEARVEGRHLLATDFL